MKRTSKPPCPHKRMTDAVLCLDCNTRVFMRPGTYLRHRDRLIDPQEHTVICPKCGHNYTHIREVFTRVGIDPVEGGAAYEGTTAKGQVDERRDCLVIVFEGECGHIFEWQIQQHKGNDYATAKYIRWNTEDYGPEPEEKPSGDATV